VGLTLFPLLGSRRASTRREVQTREALSTTRRRSYFPDGKGCDVCSILFFFRLWVDAAVFSSSAVAFFSREASRRRWFLAGQANEILFLFEGKLRRWSRQSPFPEKSVEAHPQGHGKVVVVFFLLLEPMGATSPFLSSSLQRNDQVDEECLFWLLGKR